jgi:hypothetical protein
MNGWWPQLSPDGRWVAHGTGETFLTPVTPDGALDLARSKRLAVGSMSGQWIRPDALTYWVAVERDIYERHEFNVRDMAVDVVTAATPNTGGNTMAAAERRWITQMAGRLEVDGSVIAHGVGFPVAAGGGYVAWLDTGEQRTIVRHGMGDTRRIPVQHHLHQMILGPGGEIVYGGYGATVAVFPDGRQVNATAAPDGVEFIGAGGAPMPTANMWRQDGRTWFVTTMTEQSGFGAFLRPLDEPQLGVFIPGHFDQISVALAGDAWVIATCNTQGHLTTRRVPADTPRRRLVAARPQPGPGPQPPPAEPEPEPMPPPNHLSVVQAVDAQFPQLLQANSRDTCREFLWRAMTALHAADAKWGFLSKSEGENHTVIPGVGRVSVDAIAYQGWDGVVDIMQSAGDGPGTGGVGWSVDDKKPDNVWVQPIPFVDDGNGGGEHIEPPPPPPPPPPPSDILAAIEALQRRVGILEDRQDELAHFLSNADAAVEALGVRMQQLEDTPAGGQMPVVHGTVQFSFFGLSRSFPASFTPGVPQPEVPQ